MDHLLSFSLAQEATTATTGNVIPAMAVLAALILKSSDLVKYIWAAFRRYKTDDKTTKEGRKQAQNSLVTLFVSSLAGVLAVFLFKLTTWADEIKVGAVTFDQLDVGSTTMFGLVATTLAATIYDFKKALDKTDTASTPRLFEDVEKKRLERIEKVLSKPGG